MIGFNELLHAYESVIYHYNLEFVSLYRCEIIKDFH